MIRRRNFLAGAPLAIVACSRAEEAYFFGNTTPPRTLTCPQ